MSTTTTYTGVRIVDMPDLGAVNDASSIVGEHAGSGRFGATALRDYVVATALVTATGGLTPRTLPNHFGDQPSVKDFGAKGDGATDDTAAIAAAIAWASIEGAAYGRALFFPPGDYHCAASTFTGYTGMRLYGSGIYASQITLTGGAVGWTFSNCQNTVLQYLSFRTAGATNGVCFNNGSGVNTVDTCQFVGFSGDGLQLIGTSGQPLSGHDIKDCLFLQNNGDQLHMIYSNDFWIDGNQFGVTSGTPRPAYGCLLENCSAGTYSRNYHWGNNIGFALSPGNYNRIENNRFEESWMEGAHLTGGTHNVFLGNTIHTNSRSGSGAAPNCAFTSQTYLTCANNQAYSWGTPYPNNNFAFGAGCDYLVIKGNQSSEVTGDPLYIDPSLASAHINTDAVMSFSSGPTLVPAAATSYLGACGFSAGAGFVALISGRRAAVVRFAVTAMAPPGTGQSFVYTVLVNGVASGLTVTLSGTTQAASVCAPLPVLDTLSPVDVSVQASATAAVTGHRALLMLAEY